MDYYISKNIDFIKDNMIKTDWDECQNKYQTFKLQDYANCYKHSIILKNKDKADILFGEMINLRNNINLQDAHLKKKIRWMILLRKLNLSFIFRYTYLMSIK